MPNLNNPKVWATNNFKHAFSLVGGPDEKEHLKEARIVANNIQSLIPDESKTVLEYGCGFGRMLVEMRKCSPDKYFIGCDFNSNMLQLGSKYVHGYHIQLIQSDGKTIPLKNESIDFIFTHAVLIHNDPNQVNQLFQEFYRILKPNGQMLHDFLNGDCQLSQEESKSAIKNKFPLYCYSYNTIQTLASMHDFNIKQPQKSDPEQKRISYLLTK